MTSDAGGTYNPYASGAPVTLYATGIRNAYDILFASNGQLYAPTNGSAAGSNTPAAPGQPGTAHHQRPANRSGTGSSTCRRGSTTGIPIRPAGSTSSTPATRAMRATRCELPEYPVGTKPDPNYQGPAYIFGPDYSPDGIIQYSGNAFGGALNGHLLITRYSAGKDIIDLTLNSGGGINTSAIHVGHTPE